MQLSVLLPELLTDHRALVLADLPSPGEPEQLPRLVPGQVQGMWIHCGMLSLVLTVVIDIFHILNFH